MNSDVRSTRGRVMRRTLLITLGLNALAAATKLLPGMASGSLALVAGGLDSISDAGSNVIALAAARAASRPPDERHPYGHRKFETLVAVLIGALLLATSARLARGAVAALQSGGPGPSVSAWALLGPVAAVIINMVTAAYEAAQGRRIGSDLLAADARHTLTDAAVSAAVFGGLVAVRAGFAWADAVLAFLVSALVAWVGVGILWAAAHILADTAPLDAEAVTSAALSVPGVMGAHKIRSRGPSDAVAVDLHVQVDPTLGIGRAHAIGHDVSRTIAAELPGVVDVVVHVEPEGERGEDDILTSVRRVLGDLPVAAHEVHVHRGDQTEVTIHLEIPEEPTLDEAHHVATAVEEAVRRRVAGVDAVVTHLEPRPVEAGVATSVDPAAYQAPVSQAVSTIPGLAEPHALRVSRQPGGIALSVHVRADGDMPLVEAHALAELLEARLRTALTGLDQVTIHVEPRRQEA